MHLPVAITVAIDFTRSTAAVRSKFTSSGASSSAIGIPSLGGTTLARLAALSRLSIHGGFRNAAISRSRRHISRGSSLASLSTLSDSRGTSLASLSNSRSTCLAGLSSLASRSRNWIGIGRRGHRGAHRRGFGSIRDTPIDRSWCVNTAAVDIFKAVTDTFEDDTVGEAGIIVFANIRRSDGRWDRCGGN